MFDQGEFGLHISASTVSAKKPSIPALNLRRETAPPAADAAEAATAKESTSTFNTPSIAAPREARAISANSTGFPDSARGI